jgi:hypothetical protein
MTEPEWLASVEPGGMLRFLRDNASDRKLRLFACACCRHIWHFLTDRRCRAAVEQAERYADGQASKNDLTPVRLKASKAALGKDIPDWRRTAFQACINAVGDGPAPQVAEWVAIGTVGAASFKPSRTSEYEPAVAAQVGLLRDLFRPFRPLTLDPALRTPQAVTLARAAYDQRGLPAGTLDAARLAVLADALEEVGADAELLGHLRNPGPHYRGCWAVDLLLGK